MNEPTEFRQLLIANELGRAERMFLTMCGYVKRLEDKLSNFESYYDDAIRAMGVCNLRVVDREKYCKELESKLTAIQNLVDNQAEDDGLYFRAETAPEAYLQKALRDLHKVIEEGK